MTPKDAQYLKKILTSGLKNAITNLVNFHLRSCKSENFHLDDLVLSKLYKVLR